MNTKLPDPGTRLRALTWIREHRAVLLWVALLLLVLPMRDLWSPDEPDFAQCVREMRERGAWLLPYLNGEPYNEKPILFYWLMKLSVLACDKLTGGAGFSHGVAAWALRLPSVIAAIVFMVGFHRWVERFLNARRAEAAVLVLATSPLWFWQAQFIQIDIVFATLLAWSWLAWLGGYLVLRNHAPQRHAAETISWFVSAYACLGLAFLAKGPLAVVLSGALLLAFLAWQKDWRALREIRLGRGLLLILAIVAPWYIAAGIHGGADYVYKMVVHQNFERALKAWDHIQPIYQYVLYLAADFFPWSLLIPALALFLYRRGEHRNPMGRFFILAFIVPFILLSLSKSKQGKYILMVYPFLALLVSTFFESLKDATEKTVARLLGLLLVAGLGILALAALAIGFFHAGGTSLQANAAPYLWQIRACGLFLLAGLIVSLVQSWKNRPVAVFRTTAWTLGALFLLAGTWGFRSLDPAKSYKRWTAEVQPLIAGRKVYFWQTIRSGVMVYTDHLMPEIRDGDELERKLGAEDRLVTMRREWDTNAWGMNPGRRAHFEVLLRVPVGAGEAMLLKRKPKD